MNLVRIACLVLALQLVFVFSLEAQVQDSTVRVDSVIRPDTKQLERDTSVPSERPTQPVRRDTTIRVNTAPVITPPLVPVIVPDSILYPEADSFSVKPFQVTIVAKDSLKGVVNRAFLNNPYFGSVAGAPNPESNLKQFQGKEMIFYSMIGLLLVFAFMRNAFSKYLHDLYRLIFRTTMKQRQIREQLIQTPLPSLFLNLFFFGTGGYYIALLLFYYQVSPVDNFWLLVTYCVIGLAVMYSVKFLTLKFSGWIFNIRDAMDSYIFIVFMINKIIGIFLLPVIVLLAFTQGDVYKTLLFISWIGIGGLFVYRFILTFGTVRKQIKVNPFHFLVYLSAFEIAPLLLIYKLLVMMF